MYLVHCLIKTKKQLFKNGKEDKTCVKITEGSLPPAPQTHPEGGWEAGGESTNPGQQPCSWSGQRTGQSLGAVWIREVTHTDIQIRQL